MCKKCIKFVESENQYLYSKNIPKSKYINNQYPQGDLYFLEAK